MHAIAHAFIRTTNAKAIRVTLDFQGCPIHPIRNGSPNWCRSVTDRDGSSPCVSLGHVDGSSWWFRFVIVCHFAMDGKYFWRCYGVWWKCRRTVPIGTDRDDPSQPWRMVSIHDYLSVCESLRKYSKRCSGVWWNCRRIATTRHNRDGWWRFVTAC